MTATPTNRRLGLKEKYALLTRDLGWDTTYQKMDDVFPYDSFEGIKIHDWDRWEDPFRLTMDAYWKFQGEKEKKLYAIIDAFQQSNGQLNISDARYLNAIKVFLTGVSPLEYAAHRGYAMLGRGLRGVGPRIASQMQAIDELRHAQTQVHTISHYNKYFNGLHDFHHMHDRLWYLSVPKSYFDDAMSARICPDFTPSAIADNFAPGSESNSSKRRAPFAFGLRSSLSKISSPGPRRGTMSM